MAAAAIFNFGKNVNNFGVDKDILKKNYMGRCSTAMR